VNEESAPESYLDLTLMQYFRHEDFELEEVHACLEVNPP
jgi:hypothetical protein